MLRSLLGPTLEETRATLSTLGHPRNDTLAEWFTGSPSHSGVLVSQHSAMTIGAVYRAIGLISGCVAKIPIDIMRDKGSDVHEREEGHPLEYTLNIKANDEMDAKTYREVVTAWTLAGGTAPSEIEWRGSASPKLWPIKPSRVTPRRISQRLMYDVTDDMGGNVQTIPADKIMTVIGPSPDGIVGYSVIRMARETLGLALAAERFGSGFFGNGAIPKGIFTYEGKMDEQAERHWRQMYNETHQGVANSNKAAILRAGWKYQAISIPPDDAQFLETRKFTITDIARWYGIPPHLLGDLDRSTNNNIEHQSLEFLLYCLDYWLVTWENRLRYFLLSDKEVAAGFYLRHRRRDLLAMDSKTMAESNKELVAAGIKNGNEVRKELGMNPGGPELDLYRYSMNERTAKQALAEQDKPPEDPADAKPAEPEPAESLNEAAQQGKAAQTGLQGQQITALQAILEAISTKKLPKKSGKALIRASFPLVDEGEVNEMVDSLEIKEPEPVQPAMPAATAAAKPAVAQNPKLKAAAMRNLDEAVARMRRIERNEALRAAKTPESWCKWLDGFYGEHEERMRLAIEPAAEVYVAALDAENVTFTPAWFAWEVTRSHCERSRQELLDASDGDATSFTGRVEQLVEQWETRSIELPKEVASA